MNRRRARSTPSARAPVTTTSTTCNGESANGTSSIAGNALGRRRRAARRASGHEDHAEVHGQRPALHHRGHPLRARRAGRRSTTA